MNPGKLTKVLWREQGRGDLLSPAARRFLRESAGMTLGQVGAAIGVNRGTVSRWETGARRPSGMLALRYGHLLACLGEEMSQEQRMRG